ncbi:MAG: hypothetical protein U0L43_04820 [Muribaculaceae bacterium]|nr:hypothetical protein [Muribaculaceae bacterium]
MSVTVAKSSRTQVVCGELIVIILEYAAWLQCDARQLMMLCR